MLLETITLVSAVLVANVAPAQSRPDGATLYARALAATQNDTLHGTIVYRFTSKHNNLSIGYKIDRSSHDLVSVIAAFDGKDNTVVSDVTYDLTSGSGRIMIPGTGEFTLTPYTVAPQLRGLLNSAASATYCSTSRYVTTNAVCTMPPSETFNASDYVITDVDAVAVGGKQADHLVFTPRAMQAFAVTDAWVNAESGRLLSLVVAGSGVFPSGTGSLRFDFGDAGGHWLVDHVFISLAQSSGLSGSMDYTFDDFRFSGD